MGQSLGAVGVLDKALGVLDALAGRPATLAELVGRTGLPRATAHRLAVRLEAHGMLRRDAEGRFALGPHLVVLGRAAEAALPLGDAARPALERLRDETGESVQLYVRDGDRRVCLSSLESPHGLRLIVPVGASLPLDAGSAGRVLQPSGPPGPPAADAARTPGGAGEWVASVAEREPGVASVSAPVHAADGSVLAAVSVSGPIERFGADPGSRFGPAVLACAQAIGEAVAGVAGRDTGGRAPGVPTSGERA